MNINQTLVFLDKKLIQLKIRPDLKAKILQEVLGSFKYTTDQDDSDIESLIQNYAKEIVKIVSNNSVDKEMCIDYTVFAIKKLLEVSKGK